MEVENAASRYEDAMACGEHEHGPGRELVHHAELLLYLCSICKLVLNDPVQIIACGHRFCKSCLKKFTAESSSSRCPVEMCNVQYGKSQVHRDKACLKVMKELVARCPMCFWKGPLLELRYHAQTSACQVKGAYSPSWKRFSYSQELRSNDDMVCTCARHGRSTCGNFKHFNELTLKLNEMGKVVESLQKQAAQRTLDHNSSESDLEHSNSDVDYEETENPLRSQKLLHSLKDLRKTVDKNTKAIKDLRLRLDILTVKIVDGDFIWKIPDIRRRYQEAIQKKVVSLYSPPFYSSCHGYKLCCRIYLNGDGNGKGTHISIFLIIMKSEYDNLLKWPFRNRMTFILLNQKNSAASLQASFVPIPQHPSFQKPVGVMNTACGIPKFVKQSVLQDDSFTMDDCIFINAKVNVNQV